MREKHSSSETSFAALFNNFHRSPLVLPVGGLSYLCTCSPSNPSGWDFFTAGDPTHGAVQFVDAQTAASEKLAYVGDDGVAVMTVDTTTHLSAGQNRKS